MKLWYKIRILWILFKRVGLKIADFQSRILLSLLYFVFLPIFALITKRQKNNNKSFWYKWTIKSNSIDELRKQY